MMKQSIYGRVVSIWMSITIHSQLLPHCTFFDACKQDLHKTLYQANHNEWAHLSTLMYHMEPLLSAHYSVTLMDVD